MSNLMQQTTEAQSVQTDSAQAQPSHNQPPVLAPHLVCDGAAAAIDFYTRAFGAKELFRLPGSNGKLMHACVSINGAQVMLVDEATNCGMMSPTTLKGTPVTLNLGVDDADAVFAQSVAAGATPVMPPENMFWGDRYGVLQDPFGHRWAVITPIRSMSDNELRDAASEFEATMSA